MRASVSAVSVWADGLDGSDGSLMRRLHFQK
jgi:hypothetical protein